jgi:hypothetical protein
MKQKLGYQMLVGQNSAGQHFRDIWRALAKDEIRRQFRTQKRFCAATGIGESGLSQALGPSQSSSKWDETISAKLNIPPPISTDNPHLVRMHLAVFELYKTNRQAFDDQLRFLERMLGKSR